MPPTSTTSLGVVTTPKAYLGEKDAAPVNLVQWRGARSSAHVVIGGLAETGKTWRSRRKKSMGVGRPCLDLYLVTFMSPFLVS